MKTNFSVQTQKEKELYKVVFDAGKPYEVIFKNETDLKNALKEFYENNKENDEPFNSVVYRLTGDFLNIEEDISESQFISEMISDIIENEVLE